MKLFEVKAPKFDADEKSPVKKHKLPAGVPEAVAGAIKTSAGVSKVSVKGDTVKVSIEHHNGYMEYHYTLDADDNLMVDWNGYNSPGGKKKLVSHDREKAITALVKSIKTQAKRIPHDKIYKNLADHPKRRVVHQWS